ncbi:hypothetical protein [Porphyrobacter sp. YT40]|uniref:hypothetical protein n=1 Tax=Porphyrobacter sp. YT40 TaxID=2547601 RepID=UPI00114517C3|nr:hypothetical protein [Porphyrobacter sp. YT40]QDH33353.1 hypothetical protein E2E27_02780 [Porphyrobacter sp. YT40]
MRLLSSDLFRHFSIGFVLGAVLVVGANAEEWGLTESPAQAAEMASPAQRADAPSAEFVIAP